MKHRLLFIVVLLCGLTVAIPGIAQEKLTLGDLKAKKAQKISRSELQSLVPEANVLSISGAGSERRWTNDKDGTFAASSTDAGAIGVSSSRRASKGTWSVNDEGRYCVEIEWRRGAEKWCREIYRLGDIYYGINANDGDAARANRLEFTK